MDPNDEPKITSAQLAKEWFYIGNRTPIAVAFATTPEYEEMYNQLVESLRVRASDRGDQYDL